MHRTVIFCLILVLTACAENNAQTTTANTNPSTPAAEKPNKFVTAAVNKIRQANPNMDHEQASCVVQQMTADGQIGLGEINQMNLTAAGPGSNAERLNQAYRKASQACQ